MSFRNRVVWSEGMFLRPQHFQQHDRYLEGFIEQRCGELRSYPWGFSELSIDQQLLSLGKLSISSARGVFPDGTPFSIPEDDDPPLPIDIPENTHNTLVYLTLPARRPGMREVGDDSGAESLSRYAASESDVADTAAATAASAVVQVGKMRMRLMLHNEHLDQYACLGVARIVELRSDKQVLLDEEFIPPVMDCQAAPGLAGFLVELKGLLRHRGEALAARVAEAGRGGAAEIADFLLLQLVNRYEPLAAHLAVLRGYHPEDLYRLTISMAGELATFTSQRKRPAQFETYRHDDLQATFRQVIGDLRQALSMVLEQKATALPLQLRKYGIRVSPISDRKLLGMATFVLAVHADIPVEELRKRFPAQVKIGPVEQIRQLVNVQLPGIQVRPLPVAPRQIPYHSGFVYFELDRASEYWRQLGDSGGFAIHVGAEYPGLEMEFWAIKE